MESESCRNGRPIRKRVLFPLLLIVFAFGSSALARTVPPNIIVILADELGYGDVGFKGCQDIPTSNIDSLASNARRCSNAYDTHRFSGPARADLLCGREQPRFVFEH